MPSFAWGSHPHAFADGYADDAEATARAWRDGWFHTDDRVSMDESGNLFFIDRQKDCIRRRGENISSFEVETEVLSYPGILEAAAIPAPGDDGEDEVMVVIAGRPGDTPTPAALLDYLRSRLPHYMLPRYMRFVAALPRTPTEKVQKAELRAEGVTPDTWDRVGAGIDVKGERIGRS